MTEDKKTGSSGQDIQKLNLVPNFYTTQHFKGTLYDEVTINPVDDDAAKEFISENASKYNYQLVDEECFEAKDNTTYDCSKYKQVQVNVQVTLPDNTYNLDKNAKNILSGGETIIISQYTELANEVDESILVDASDVISGVTFYDKNLKVCTGTLETEPATIEKVTWISGEASEENVESMYIILDGAEQETLVSNLYLEGNFRTIFEALDALGNKNYEYYYDSTNKK